jgi:hypothetical protein
MTDKAEMKLEAGGWSVYFRGKRVIAGEGYVVASNIEYGLNGGGLPIGECQEVVDQIRSSNTREVGNGN